MMLFTNFDLVKPGLRTHCCRSKKMTRRQSLSLPNMFSIQRRSR